MAAATSVTTTSATVEASASSMEAPATMKSAMAKAAAGKVMPPVVSIMPAASHDKFAAVIGACVSIIRTVSSVVVSRVGVVAALGRVADSGIHGATIQK